MSDGQANTEGLTPHLSLVLIVNPAKEFSVGELCDKLFGDVDKCLGHQQESHSGEMPPAGSEYQSSVSVL